MERHRGPGWLAESLQLDNSWPISAPPYPFVPEVTLAAGTIIESRVPGSNPRVWRDVSAIRYGTRSVESGMKPSFLLAGGGLAGVLLLGACGGSDRSESDANGAATAITPEAATAPISAPPSTTTSAAPTTTTTAAPTTATSPATTATSRAPTTTRPASTAVTVRQFQFMPQELVMKAGSMVTWTNQDQILHTATSGTMPGTADGTFDGPMDGVGKSFTFTFDQPGTYAYFCSRHTSMTGKVVVQ